MGLKLERVVNADNLELFVPHPGHSGAPTRSIGVLSERSRMYRNALLRDMNRAKDLNTGTKIFDKSTNTYYTCPELDQEIDDFFANTNPDTVAQSPYIGLIRAVDLLEGDGPAPANDAPRPSEAPQATDLVAGSPSEAPQATDLVAGSPLDQFAIHPIIPLALGLGLFLLLVFFFLRKVWKNR
jgi:hypothetical protein